MEKIKAFFKNIIDGLTSRDRGTVFRTVLQVLAYINQLVALIGRTSFADAAWYQWLSVGVTFTITAVTWWYNNDITSAAKWGSKVMDALKDGKITEDEVKELLGGNDDE